MTHICMYIIISMKLVSLNLRLIKLREYKKKVSSRSDERLIIGQNEFHELLNGLYIMNLRCNKSYERKTLAPIFNIKPLIFFS